MYQKLLKAALPLPKLTDGEKYLFVAAHPDDIEVGAGGTVAKLVSLGKRVDIVVITDGGCGSKDLAIAKTGLAAIRKAEAIAAAEVLGVTKISFLAYPDAGDYRAYDVAKALATIMVELNPDFVLAPDPKLPSEIHPDHLKAGEALMTAVLFAGYPLVYQENVGPVKPEHLSHFRFRNLGFFFTHRPNRYLTIDPSHREIQKHAIICHESQFPDPEELKQILLYLKFRGRSFGSFGRRSKEGFFVLGKLHVHCYPEVNRY